MKKYRGEYRLYIYQALDKATQGGNIRDVIFKKLSKDTYRKKTPCSRSARVSKYKARR